MNVKLIDVNGIYQSLFNTLVFMIMHINHSFIPCGVHN